jgi:Outer membrane lipoprotein-sorting protein
MTIHRLALCISVLLASSAAGQAITPQPPVANITAKEIVAKMTENNRKRREQLKSYVGQREYHLLYTGFPGRREAGLVVEARYRAPDSKEFTVISQSGSHWLVNKVLKKLLETEKEAADPKSQASTAVTEENYHFELLGKEDVGGRPAYVLQVEPKTASKLLYRGKIWVDVADFAVSQIDAEPAKRPSIWISKTLVHHTYQKIGEFWLPAQNESTTDVRLGGHATLSIHYTDYRLVADTGPPATERHPGDRAPGLTDAVSLNPVND